MFIDKKVITYEFTLEINGKKFTQDVDLDLVTLSKEDPGTKSQLDLVLPQESLEFNASIGTQEVSEYQVAFVLN